MVVVHHFTATGPETKKNMAIAKAGQFSHIWQGWYPSKKKIAKDKAIRLAKKKIAKSM